jgi:hypothetical protein
MLNDDGVRRLAIAVLQQAVTDLQGPIPEYRRCAAAFMARREDFDEFWCVLVGLQGGAVHERLDHQQDASRLGERSGIDLLSGVSAFSRRISRAVEHRLDDCIGRTQLVQGSSRVGRGHRS